MRKGKIDVIIPAFKAHDTIIRCLSSIACQTILDDVAVTVVNDCCPEGDYANVIGTFAQVMNVKEIRLPENRGPGLARQAGIDASDGEFIAFVDADDMLFKATALEKLRDEMQADETCMCASGSFTSPKYKDDPEKFSHVMVWLFAKLYRREFLNKYKVRFNNTRANEDSGFNRKIVMLCDNPSEQIKHIEENLYLYNKREDSITNINGRIYYYDAGICGGIDNMIDAIEHVRKVKPFSTRLVYETVQAMASCYFNYTEQLERTPDLAIQLWEYIKKYYHTCYKRIEGFVTDDALASAYSLSFMGAVRNYGYTGIIPKIGFREYMRRLQTEEYDPHLIDEIREEMEADPDYKQILENNISCGVQGG